MRKVDDEKRQLGDQVDHLMDSVQNFHREKQMLTERLDAMREEKNIVYTDLRGAREYIRQVPIIMLLLISLMLDGISTSYEIKVMDLCMKIEISRSAM